jgi:hypothetical protein
VPSSPDEPTGVIWIKTDPDASGLYVPTLEIDDDTSMVLDHDLAMAYAEYVLTQVARAEHDSRILRQLTASVSRDGAVQVIVDLRADRPPVSSPVPYLSMEPGVSQASSGGFLKLHIKGSTEPVGQWSLEQGREHAMHVIQAIEMARLDEAYRKCLVTMIGLDDATARSAVGGLATYDDEPR